MMIKSSCVKNVGSSMIYPRRGVGEDTAMKDPVAGRLSISFGRESSRVGVLRIRENVFRILIDTLRANAFLGVKNSTRDVGLCPNALLKKETFLVSLKQS